MKINRTGDKIIKAALHLGIFVSMFVFFYCMHPIVILDSDDWYYISYARPAVPSPTFWNPCRILPELLMPGCGWIALALFRIGMAGYIESQMLVFAVVISVFITVYAAMFDRVMRRRAKLTAGQSAFMTALFIIMHFLIFRTEDSGNVHLFWSYDASCFFYYTIPMMLNCTLVMYFMSSDILDTCFRKDRIVFKAVLAVVVYLAVFSNLFCSVIIAVFAALTILNRLIRKQKQQAAAWAVLALWILSVILEMSGGRSSVSIGRELDLSAALSGLIADFDALSIYFMGICLLFILSAAAVMLIRKTRSREFLEYMILFAALGAIVTAAEVLLCAKVGPEYIQRPQVFFATAFPLLMMSFGCAAFSVKNCPMTFLAVPAISLVALTVTNTQEVTFAENNTMGIPWQTCVSVDNDIIAQTVAADLSGAEEFNLEMMDTGWDDNWPHTSFMADNTFKQTMLKHGLIKRNMKINAVWSTDFNERNGIVIEFFSPWRHYE